MIPLRQEWPESLARRYREAGYWTGETFWEFLQRSAETWPEHTAVTDGQRRWSYQQLLQHAEQASAAFLAAGLNPGDRVVVQLPNVPEFISVVFGLFRAGMVPVYALPAHRMTEIAHFVSKAEARGYVFVGKHDNFQYADLAAALLADKTSGLQVTVDIADWAKQGGPSASEDLVLRKAQPPAKVSASDVAFMQISGGSTGLSKLIPRTHDDYLYSVRASAEICQLNEKTVFLAALPIAHNFPMSSPGFLGVLYAGGTVVMASAPSPDVAFPLIEKEQVTITALVPPLVLLWMKAVGLTGNGAETGSGAGESGRWSKATLSSLQMVQVGGAKFMPESAARVKSELGCELQQVFGMAEGLVNYTRPGDPEHLVIGTQGRPISDADEIRIVDEQDQPVSEGEVGQLLTRGPYTIRGYHNAEEANQRSFTDEGFYRTGDLVKMTPEGYLVVQGRATDHINRAGEKVSAEEIEDHLIAHPQVFDVAVVSIPDQYLGERSCAFVVPEGEKPRPVALKKWMRERHVADFKIPDQIVFVDSLQTTAVGKISRKQLRAQLRDKHLQSLSG
ncbi:2,3-dihydroxybenzoate-AMP ligase [Pseudohongiella nitratireducens]|uniref:salicylate--[aryl-carrier protein] ligase n=1 Tax=Pseudohongiella nitratireducens TaxID=1768907 RepID=A0A917LSG9_9GAMM|nr:AMP-binding protein [Pseudohongiella nitratireducens]GGG53025.1 2,3-dihydroxybenzoate-AMP ligase [Pseudohongiella nitratireducens]